MNLSSTTGAKCFVPSCRNTTTNSRHKLFVNVKETLKKKWCEEVNVEYKPGRRLFCCEDHLNLEEDLENYQYYKLMKGRPVLKATAKLRRTHDLPSCSKYETITVVGESSSLKSLLLKPIATSQMHTKNYFNMMPTQPTATSYASTHSIKIDTSTQCHVEMMDRSTSTRRLMQKTMDLPSLASSASSASCEITPVPSLYGFTSDTETTASLNKDHSSRNQMLKFIAKDPKAYLGLTKQYYWLIKHIATQSVTKISELFIIIVLFKIKINDPVNIICDEFQISRLTFSKALYTGLQVLANFFQNLIYIPTLLQIKENLPLAFKIRYSNVCIILDAFEIEIQKPHNPIRQAQTWSQYKNANTVKYLIGSTPNGFVSYVSKGYGGRISDKALVEKSDLIECLPDCAVIMADRGFKEIESHLMAKGIKLLRPPSVYASSKPTKEEVIQSKVVASLRVHIERVIRRVREFRFLKPHSVVSHKHVGYLDNVVLIACGLINLQSEIIKTD